MLLVRCDRRDCKTEPVEAPGVLLPKGWFRLTESNFSLHFCSEDCFDTYWGRRRWKEKKPAMQALGVSEEKLLPKG